MTGRADFALELQLTFTEKEAVNAEAKEAITDVLQHILSGGRTSKGQRFKAGRKLITLLEIARLRASEEAEWHIVRLLQDSLDYATGRILKPDFEERYQLFHDSKRDPLLRKVVSAEVAGGFHFATQTAQKFLENHPEATASELLTHLSSLTKDARFLESPEDKPGRYHIIHGVAEQATWLRKTILSRVDVLDPLSAVQQIIASPDALQVLINDKDGQTLLKAAELKQRQESLDELREIVESPTATEQDLQYALEDKPWIFGGRFVGVAARRRLTPGNEIDIPLIRADGSLHIVEIKRAMRSKSIIRRHRGAWIVTSEVQKAIGQSINYLVGLDENRQHIRDEFGIETRRASAVVLIGHPALHPQVPEDELNEVLRTLNTHLNRIEVLTYKELLDNAQRSLGDFPAS